MTSTPPHTRGSAEPAAANLRDANSQNGTRTAPQASEPDIPVQRHAGKVGYGPNYQAGPTLGEKVAGLKEELVGKIKHNPERFRHGHDVLTGEEKRKKLTGEDEPNPFHAEDKSDKEGPKKPSAELQPGVTDHAEGIHPNSKATPSGQA